MANGTVFSEQADLPPQRPTRVRFVVLAYLCALTFVLYLDRVCIGQAGPAIQRDMHLTDETSLGYVYASFTIAYGIFMAAAGRLGDRYGSRGVLVAIVVWWSLFTALTGAATGLIMLIVVRFIFGAGEAGALPNCARILNRWFPAEARGLPQGLLNTAALVGGAIAPPAAAYTMWLLDVKLAPYFSEHFGFTPIGWRWTFVIFATLGIVWAVFFWYSYRDDPHTHPRVNSAESDYITRGQIQSRAGGPAPPVPWRLVLASRNIWLIGFINTCASFVSYLFMFWLPKYLQSGRSVEPLDSGLMACVVLGGGALGSAVGGLCSDQLMRLTGRKKRSRSMLGAIAMALAALALLASIYIDNSWLASWTISLAFFLSMMQIATWWGAVADISGDHVATLFGLMNSMGIFGAVGAQIFFGWMADEMKARGLSGRAQWDPALYYFVAALLIGAIAWLLVNSNKSAVQEESKTPSQSPIAAPAAE